jgi:hypothetical protein
LSRVELFLKTAKVDAPLLEGVHGVDEVMKRAAKPVKSPDNEACLFIE